MKHKAKPSGSSGGSRLRLTILAATVAAFLLVPAAQAFANGTMTVKIVGTGSGEVDSTTGAAGSGFLKGIPPIECSYNGATTSGTCNDETSLEEELEGVGLRQTAAPGSVFVKWVLNKPGPAGINCGLSGIEPTRNKYCTRFGFEGENPELEVTAEFALAYPLTIVKEGTGTGTIVSSPAGIECGATCSAAFEENAKVTLTASPSAGSLFVSWKGCEKGGVNGRQCTVTMDKAKTVNAKFLTAYDVTVNREGTGLGKVSSSPGGVLCLSNCSSTTAAFKEGTAVTLSAAPTKNYVFTEWTGDCSGAGPCSLGSLGEDKEVGAKFTEVAKHLLTVTKSGGGQGTAKSNVAGINCGATCSTMASAYYQGAVVELTATPGKGSAFGGWSGSGCSGVGTCTVTMSEAKAVTAEFK